MSTCIDTGPEVAASYCSTDNNMAILRERLREHEWLHVRIILSLEGGRLRRTGREDAIALVQEAEEALAKQPPLPPSILWRAKVEVLAENDESVSSEAGSSP